MGYTAHTSRFHVPSTTFKPGSGKRGYRHVASRSIPLLGNLFILQGQAKRTFRTWSTKLKPEALPSLPNIHNEIKCPYFGLPFDAEQEWSFLQREKRSFYRPANPLSEHSQSSTALNPDTTVMYP